MDLRCLTRATFKVADALAFLIGFGSIAAAMAYPIVAPIHATMSNTDHAIERTLLIVLVAAAVALGALLFRRRRIAGLVLVVLPCVGWGVAETSAAGLWLAAFLMVVFGSPFLLSYVDMQQKKQSDNSSLTSRHRPAGSASRDR